MGDLRTRLSAMVSTAYYRRTIRKDVENQQIPTKVGVFFDMIHALADRVWMAEGFGLKIGEIGAIRGSLPKVEHGWHGFHG